MIFECEYCGWLIEGGDETGIHIYDENGEYAEEIDYCFHCGKKLRDSDD